MTSRIFVALFVSILLTVPALAQDVRAAAKVGLFEVRVEPWQRGMVILVDDIVVSIGSNIVVTTPPWTPHFYLGPDKRAVETAKVEDVAGGKRITITHRSQEKAYEAEETLTLTEDGVLVQELAGRYVKDEREALVQYQIAGLNPALIIGRPYKARTGGQDKSGVAAVVAKFEEVPPSTLAGNIEWIEFDSRIGPIRIEAETDQKIICYDHRKSRWADPGAPKFWLGDNGTRISREKGLRYKMTYRLPKPPAAAAQAKDVQITAKLRAMADAQSYEWYTTDDDVFPLPKSMISNGTDSPVPKLLAGVNMAGPILPKARAARELERFLWDEFGIERSLVPCDDSSPLQISVMPFMPEGSPPEAYELTVNPTWIDINAADEAGLMHAIETLKQLVTRTPDGKAIIKGRKIADHPSLGFRGIHLFTGGKGTKLHEDLLRRVMGPLKINKLVLQCDYVKWDGHPNIHDSERGMSKDEVRRIIAVCDELGIEVIPVVMSLGHMQWMFHNNQNLELAEDPEFKFQYCVTNPKTYDFIFSVYEEALELFKPRVFHIGHDEFANRGRVPFRESSKPYTVEQLFMMDTLKIHKWLVDRGVKVMMWGDMLLAIGEAPDACHAQDKDAAARKREGVPDDIIIADWHYTATPPESFTSLDIFHKEGHQSVACTWNRPQNITNFAKAAYDQQSLGLMQTTWGGYSLDPASFKTHLQQYSLYVLAAEAAWNAASPPDADTHDGASRFMEMMGLSALRLANRSGNAIDLSAAFNYSTTAKDASGWFGFGPEHDLSALPGGAARVRGIAFELGSDDAEHDLIALRGKLAPAGTPTAVEIGLSATASQIALLHIASTPCAAGTLVGSMVVAFDDGTSERVEVKYGTNVFAYGDLAATPESPLAERGKTRAGQGFATRLLIWSNPQPSKTISSVRLESANSMATWLIRGITLMGDEKR